MHFFKAFGQSLRRCFDTSPKTLIKKGIRAQKKFHARSDDPTDYQAQYFLNKTAFHFSEAKKRCHGRNDDISLMLALFSLAIADWELYMTAGKSRERLDRVIASYEEALAIPSIPSDQVLKYVDLLTNTAYAYKERFEQWHARPDIERSISLYKNACSRTQHGSPEYVEIVQIIGSIYWKLHCNPTSANPRTDHEMDQADTYFQQAYACPTENRSVKANCAYNLACIYYTMFQRHAGFQASNKEDYLSKTISFYRSAIEFMDDGTHPYRPQALRAISLTLWYRYDQNLEEQDLKEAQNFASLALPHYIENAEESKKLTSIVNFGSATNAATTSEARAALRRATLDTLDRNSSENDRQDPGPISPSGVRAEASPLPLSPTRSVVPYEVDEASDEQPPRSPIRMRIGRSYTTSSLRVSGPSWSPPSPKVEYDAPRVPKLVIDTGARIVRP